MSSVSTPQVLADREREQMMRRRDRAGARVARERAHTTGLALVCYVVLGAAMIGEVYFGWLPGSSSVRVAAPDPAAKRFAETRLGQVVITGEEGDACRELKFHNDTGRFSGGNTINCNAALPSDNTSLATPSSRVLSIRDRFSGR
jgi:hypothetical protein